MDTLIIKFVFGTSHLNFLAAAASASASAQPVKCEVCGTYFESRRGLSSHARLHLRQLGVALSESSGAPISLLYQLVRERDGCLPEFKADSSADGIALLRNTSQQESRNLSEPEDTSQISPQTKSFAESPTRPKESMHTLLPSSPSCSTLVESRASEGSSSSAENQTSTKPLWAPLETDAPIRLGMTEFWMYQHCISNPYWMCWLSRNNMCSKNDHSQ